MRPKFNPLYLALAALTLAGLACQTITSLPQRLRSGAAPSASGPTVEPPSAGPTAAPNNPGAGGGALTLPNGLTLGSLEETQAFLSGGDAKGLEELASETYSDQERNAVGARLKYTINLNAGTTQVAWGYGWCATTADILKQNLSQMRVEFEVNGQAVDPAQLLTFTSQSQDNLQCQSMYVVVSNWPKGNTTLTTRITFEQKINDGMGDYPAGDQEFTYTVTAP